jgi:uncharacterized membrane protein
VDALARMEPSAAARPARLEAIDALRGVAIAAMVVYHFSWDLRFFGYISADVAGDLGWRLFARAIAGTFLALVGVSLVLSTRGGFDRRRFLRRLGVIAAGAVAITAVTLAVMPDVYVFFGILHSIAVASVLGLPFVRAPALLTIVAAIFCFAAPALFAGPAFDSPALLWLGLFTRVPQSNDFVPVFPWFGVVLAGIAAARLAPLAPASIRARFAAFRAPRPLLLAGRYSLAIYLLHQPILFGLVYAAASIVPPSPVGFEDWHFEVCTRQCVEAETEPSLCRRICSCLGERASAEGLAEGLSRNSLSEEQISRYFALNDQCRAEAEAP